MFRIEYASVIEIEIESVRKRWQTNRARQQHSIRVAQHSSTPNVRGHTSTQSSRIQFMRCRVIATCL